MRALHTKSKGKNKSKSGIDKGLLKMGGKSLNSKKLILKVA